MTRRRRRWRVAAAAAVVVTATTLVSINSVPENMAVVEVASISKSTGESGLLRNDRTLERVSDQQIIRSGQTIVTGSGSSLGLAWYGGGSLRVDENTTLRFLADDQIELQSGRVYYDSRSSIANGSSLVIHTDYGDVRHVGTQYMTDISETDLLRVSVREGQVAITGLYYEALAGVGEQVVLHGDRAPLVTKLATHSAEWRWVETVAPTVDMEGKTFYDLLEWVCRETGLRYRFEDAAAEEAAHESLTGVEDGEPMVLLRVGAAAAQLTIEQVDGVIVISQRGP
ncbi:MAG: FecR domain-containing protein [Pseudomonadota bacterium]